MFRQNAVATDISALRGIVDPKKAALLFDKLIILRTEEHKLDYEGQSNLFLGMSEEDVEWLKSKDFLCFVDDPSQSLFSTEDKNLLNYRGYRRASLAHVALLREDQGKEQAIVSSSEFITRYSAASLSTGSSEDVRYVPLIYDDPKFSLRGIGANIDNPLDLPITPTYEKATALLMTEFPVPDECTAWDQILDFRENPDAQLSFFTLRDWIKTAVTSAHSVADLRDKIELDMAATKKAMKDANIKHRFETIKISLTAAASLIENLCKLRLGKLAESAFSIGETSIKMLDEESKLAKNGPYYILKAQSVFGASSI